MKHKLTEKDKEILEVKVDNLENITSAISEKDILMELWSREEECKLAPAGDWKTEHSIAEIFTFKVYILSFLAIMTVIPLFFYVPYLVSKYIDRKKIRQQILLERMTVKTAVPIPITRHEDFKVLEKSYWGNRLIKEGIIYKLNVA